MKTLSVHPRSILAGPPSRRLPAAARGSEKTERESERKREGESERERERERERESCIEYLI